MDVAGTPPEATSLPMVALTYPVQAHKQLSVGRTADRHYYWATQDDSNGYGGWRTTGRAELVAIGPPRFVFRSLAVLDRFFVALGLFPVG